MSLAQIADFAIVGVIAVVVIGLLIWGASKPLVRRLLSVLGMGTGTGFSVWGIMLAATKEESPLGSAAGRIAVGAEGLVGAIGPRVISLCGSCTGRK